MNESLRPPCSDNKENFAVTRRFRTCTGTGTDLDSVVGTILARTKLRWGLEETIREWIFKQGVFWWEKTIYCRKVSNLRQPRETDFDSVVITTWVRPVKMSIRRNHPWVNVKVVFDRKNLIPGKCKLVQRNRFWFCWDNPLAKTIYKVNIWTSDNMIDEWILCNVEVCCDRKKTLHRQISNMRSPILINRFPFCCGYHFGQDDIPGEIYPRGHRENR